MTPHPAEIDPEALLADCDVERTRRGGPGGQHRNKVETAIVLTHRPTGVRAEASERRSQEQNQKEALRRLRLRLALEVRVERSGGPSALLAGRTRGGRIAINPGHDDFPALLAEALDVLALTGFDPKGVGEQLGISSSQLVKLLKLEPKAFERVNAERVKLGAHALK